VDETRARICLEQGRITEAERVARSAVRVQEKGGNTTLLTEALITYGRVLARSEKYGASLGTFRWAVELSENAGLMNRAAEAALAAFQELGEHLAVSERGQLLSGRGVGRDKLAMEHHMIKLALEEAEGRVSQAARLVGMSWQGLTYALRTRHQDLLEKRTPVRHRKRRQ
jgi:DNA-binding NtrC family response regulator